VPHIWTRSHAVSQPESAGPAKHVRYYERHSLIAALSLAIAAVRAPTRVRRIALTNRFRDYVSLGRAPHLLELHRELSHRLARAADEWQSHHFGEGYFYQGLSAIGITGLRNTEQRIAAMDLISLVGGRRVLEIGCNTGFLSIALARAATRVVGCDINPHLIGIAETVSGFLNCDNVRFWRSTWEQFEPDESPEVLLSFGSHTPYDHNATQTIGAYIEKCHETLGPGGVLAFESHAPAYEGSGWNADRAEIERRFDVTGSGVLAYGTFLDRGRTFIVGRRR